MNKTALGKPRPIAAVIAVVVACALLASGCSGSITSDAVGQTFSDSWDPQSLPPIPVNQSGAGAVQPVYANSVVTDQQGLAVSLQPTLKVTTAPANVEYTFYLSDVDGTQIWHKSSGNNEIKLDPGKLAQGGEYLWWAVATVSKQKYGPFAMSVDTVRAGKQPIQGVGPFSVALASGDLSYSPDLRSIQGPSGQLGVNLSYAPTANPTPGVPAGWALQGVGQGWSHLQVYSGGSVALVSVTGQTVGYSQSGNTNTYSVVSPPGRPAPTGGDATLVKNSDETWTATSPSGMVANFAAADSQNVAYLTQTYNDTTTTPVYQLQNGKIVSVTDPISKDPDFAVTLTYDDTGDCPDPDTANGFVATTTGMLCQIGYPDGSTTRFEYLAGADGPLLARIVDYPDTTDSKSQVTDIGYDLANRIVALREPAAANAQVSNARSDAAQLLETLSYNGEGQVAAITKPAALAGQPQSTYNFNYATPGVAVMTQTCPPDVSNCPQTTAGFNERVTYDLNTLLQTSNEDSRNHTVTTTWDTANDQRQQDVDYNNRITQYTYDANGNLSQQSGPYMSGESGSAPYTKYAYDQDLSSGTATDMHGFNISYWSGASPSGTPASRTFGPVINKEVPRATDWTWPASPLGTTGAWTARLTGTIAVPGSSSKSKSKGASGPSLTTLSVAPSAASLWIDGVVCPQPSCQMGLAPGGHQIRIDVPYATTEQSGYGFSLQWKPPTESALAPVPMTAIGPGYGLVSATSKNDATAASTPFVSQQYQSYADPATKNVTKTWVQQTPGVTSQTAYEPFDPTNPTDGQYGRILNTTMPAGNQTTFSYYAAGDEVELPCTGTTQDQHAMPKTVGRDGQTYQAYYDQDGRVVGSSISPESGSTAPTYCITYNDAGQIQQQTIPSRGDDQPTTTIDYQRFVNGDPFATQMQITKGNQTYTASSESDLYGRVISSTDVWGTQQKYTYDPYNGKQTSVQTTPANGGYSETTTNTYNGNGDLQTVAVDGQTVATLGTPDSTSWSVEYGNGVNQTFKINDFNQFTSQTWATTNSQQFSYSADNSPAGRILDETYALPGAAPVAFDYTYDTTGRLVAACVQDPQALPNTCTGAPSYLAHHSWQYGFDANSNRTQQLVDAQVVKGKPVGGQQIDYTYNSNDQLQSTTDPSMPGQMGYSSWGEMQQLGPLTLDYDSASLVSSVTDHSTGQQVSYNRLGSALIGKTTTAAGGTPVEVRYAAGGFILDGNSKPQWQAIDLPGGTTLIRNVSNPQAIGQQYQHNTVRGQNLWTSDNSGKEVSPASRHLYSPYGEELLTATTAPATPAADVPAPNYQWQGGNGLQTDQFGTQPGQTISLINSGSRMYVPALGRFTSPDPKLAGSVNAYDYANQDPINHSDPSGTMAGWLKFLITTVITVVVAAVATVAMLGMGWAAAAAVDANIAAGDVEGAQAAAGILDDGYVSGTGAAPTLGVVAAGVTDAVMPNKGYYWIEVMTTVVITAGAMALAARLAMGIVAGVENALAEAAPDAGALAEPLLAGEPEAVMDPAPGAGGAGAGQDAAAVNQAAGPGAGAGAGPPPAGPQAAPPVPNPAAIGQPAGAGGAGFAQ